MKTKYRFQSLSFTLILFVLIFGCTKNSNPVGNEPETVPSITSITADKTKIFFGGNDQAVLTCNAKGGNLKYIWQVDLGDLVPMNKEVSKVSFTGAACCVGDKIITCTVSNSLGSVSKSITISILETISTPEIITIESDKTEIQSGGTEKANLVCYAIGGNLTYSWETDCGDIIVNQTDKSKITYAAIDKCIGTKNIKCTVKNEKGSFSKTFQITVK
jgi:hypothetical protein